MGHRSLFAPQMACRCGEGDADRSLCPFDMEEVDLKAGLEQGWPADNDDDDDDEDDFPPPPRRVGDDGWPLPPPELVVAASTVAASSTAAGSTGVSGTASPSMGPESWAPATYFASYSPQQQPAPSPWPAPAPAPAPWPQPIASPWSQPATADISDRAHAPDGRPTTNTVEGSRVVRPPADEARVAETLPRATPTASISPTTVRHKVSQP